MKIANYRSTEVNVAMHLAGLDITRKVFTPAQKRALYLRAKHEEPRIKTAERVQKACRKQGRGAIFESRQDKKARELSIRVAKSQRDLLTSPNRDDHPAVRAAAADELPPAFVPNDLARMSRRRLKAFLAAAKQ